eukprot:561518-Pleurochrysis_carterae.AAC.1
MWAFSVQAPSVRSTGTAAPKSDESWRRAIAHITSLILAADAGTNDGEVRRSGGGHTCSAATGDAEGVSTQRMQGGRHHRMARRRYSSVSKLRLVGGWERE